MLTLLDVRCVLTHLPRLARLELGAASLLPPRVERALLEAQPDLELSFTWGDTSSEGTSTSDEEGTSSESSEEEGSEEGMPPAP